MEMKEKILKYSQNGEEGIIQEIFNRIGITTGKCCEFGNLANHKFSNTQYFVENGFEGVFFDKNSGTFITPENVNKLVPYDLVLLSIDIDGNDYAVWRAYKGTPEVVVIEINSGMGETTEHFSEEKGCSFAMMNNLAKEKGYHLVRHTGNCIYVLNKFAELFPEPVEFKRSWM